MKHAYKRAPVDNLDARAMECWFTDLAQQGLEYVGNFFGFYKFLKTEPRQTRYCVQFKPCDADEPSQELQDAYAAAGWAFVCPLDKFYFVWRTTQAQAIYPRTDPDVARAGYDKLHRNLRNTLACTVIIFAVYIAVMWLMLFSSKSQTIDILLSPFYLSLSVIQIPSLLQNLKQIKRIQGEKKQCVNGDAPSREQDYRGEYRVYRALGHLSSALFVALLLPLAVMMLLHWEKSIADVTEPLPYLPLDVIEQRDDFRWAQPYYSEKMERDKANFVTYTCTPLALETYEICQQGESYDGTDGYMPYASTHYYRLACSALAPIIFDRLMQEYVYRWRPEQYEIKELDAFERTVIARNKTDRVTHLFVQEGKQVVYIYYCGNADLQERLDALGAVLSGR